MENTDLIGRKQELLDLTSFWNLRFFNIEFERQFSDYNSNKMKIEIHIVSNSKIAEITSDTVFISTTEDVLELLGNLYFEEVDSIILHQKNIIPDFFDLKNGIAGEILQKFSNYRMRLAIVGDFTQFSSKSIKDFIFESNRNRQINFVGTIKEALQILSNK